MFLRMKILEALQRRGKSPVVLKSIFWKTVISEFQEQKNMDVEPYLVSSTLRGNIFFIKTNNPLINSEIMMLEWEILEKFHTKIEKMWISGEKYSMRCK